MEAQNIAIIKDQLVDRRERLQKVIEKEPGNSNFMDLLQQVDSALNRMSNGKYGICEVCNEPIEEEILKADPLVRFCIDHLDVEQQRALENDLKFAAEIQGGLLPKNNLSLSGWDFSYHYKPFGIVSGDFCDMVPVDNDSFIFVLGDVSGKGVSASLMMSQLHALIHSLLTFNLPVDETVKKTNRLFCESAISANYATLVLGKAMPGGEIEVCVAGHNPPLLSQNGKIVPLGATGVPVGLFCGSEYEVKRFKLEKDDYLLLYTDGLTESMVNEIEYGEDRLIEHLLNNGGSSPQGMIEGLLNDHKKFLKDSRPGDDITVAVIRRG